MKFQDIIPIDYFSIKLVIPLEVYYPKEDTDLCWQYLQDFQKFEKKPNILEIGIGAGTLSLLLAKKLKNLSSDLKIIGIDINPIAVEVANFNANLNQLDKICKFIQGDLFYSLKRDEYLTSSKFDLIFFNAPYLPTDDLITDTNRQLIDSAWEGGLQGDEIILRFLNSVSDYINTNGDIIFISSSTVDQSKILQTISELNFSIINQKKKHYFFEDILLYHLKMNN